MKKLLKIALNTAWHRRPTDAEIVMKARFGRSTKIEIGDISLSLHIVNGSIYDPMQAAGSSEFPLWVVLSAASSLHVNGMKVDLNEVQRVCRAWHDIGMEEALDYSEAQN